MATRLRELIVITGFLVMATSAATLPAAQVPLSDLLVPGATIQSGDKIFSDFTYTKTGDNPTPDNVEVVTVTDNSGNFGLRFVGEFLDHPGGSASTALITFNVSVPAGSNLLISDAILQANPAVFGGPGLAEVTETFLPVIDMEKLVVFDFGNGNDDLADELVFAQTFTTLPVQKNIGLHATGQTGAVALSFIDQYFSQIPEPSSVLLLACGLVGWTLIRRR